MVQEFSVAYEFTRTTGYQYQKEKPRSDRHSEQIQTTHTRMVPCKHLKTKAISKFGKVAVHRGSSIGAQEKWLSIGASWKSGCPSELPLELSELPSELVPLAPANDGGNES